MSRTWFKTGSVHGRFQPLHNGHLEYIEAALTQCDFLYVGITQYTSHKLVQVQSTSAVHRGHPHNNPLTYFERTMVIDAVLGEIGVSRDRYAVVPFPIEEPHELGEFLPTAVPIFTTTYDDWNREKIRTLEQIGYEVVNLWTRPQKDVAGHEIRSLMRSGSQAWRQHVPDSAARLLDEYDVAGRLSRLVLPQGS